MRNHVLPIVTREAADEENARWLAAQAPKAHGKSPAAPAKSTHRHACGHGCACYAPEATDCRRCRREKWRAAQADRFGAAVARLYDEDGLTTEQLLERRA